MSIDEISDVMGVSRRTVSYYLKKLVKKLSRKSPNKDSFVE